MELQTWEVAPAAFGSPDEFDSADDYNNPGTGWWLIDWFVPSVNLRVSLPYFEGVPEDDRPANLSGIPEPDPDNPKVINYYRSITRVANTYLSSHGSPLFFRHIMTHSFIHFTPPPPILAFAGWVL